jgi:hypothetical protein
MMQLKVGFICVGKEFIATLRVGALLRITNNEGGGGAHRSPNLSKYCADWSPKKYTCNKVHVNE